MKVNFFEQGCNSTTRSAEFGICDDQDGSRAYINAERSLLDQWGAVVSNPGKFEVRFTAIDNCISLYKNSGVDLESSCDGMLTYNNDVDFIELKNKRDSWKLAGAAQVENTIRLFVMFHDLKQFRRRRAFVANRSFPNFSEYDTGIKQRFWTEYRMRLFAQRMIEL